MTQVTALPVAAIQPSKTNPRTRMEPKVLEELTESIRKVGVLQPVLVRSLNGKAKGGVTHELVAGHRRLAAARDAGLEEIPVVVRALTDLEVLEIQLVENLQRADLHPLEEAQGYYELVKTGKYDVARIAERIGRSVAYVYDRLKLIALTPDAKAIFLEDKITAGHAILLARLTPADQKRAIGDVARNGSKGGVFEHEYTLWDPEERDEEKGLDPQLKPRSVRELQAWIDEHVRFNAKEPDPMLFPETAATLEASKKIIPITHLHYIQPEAREGRTFFPRSWKRADGERKSKACEHSVTGFVAIGPGRGDAFAVCVAKDRCAIHWPQSKKKAKGTAASGALAYKEGAKRDEERWARERAEREARAKRWQKALPAILEATAAAVRKASVEPGGILAKILDREIDGPRKPSNLIPRGSSLEDLLRHLAFRSLEATADGWNGDSVFGPVAKGLLGVDVEKILNQAAPVQTSGKTKAATPGTCSRCGCSDAAACEGGCSWVDEAHTVCSRHGKPKPRKRGTKKAAAR